jgi:hypothetical protein
MKLNSDFLGFHEFSAQFPSHLISKFTFHISTVFNCFCELMRMLSQGQLSGIDWVPMCWGGVNAQDIDGIEAQIPAGSNYLLGFNEPNFISQSNLTPAQAASM